MRVLLLLLIAAAFAGEIYLIFWFNAELRAEAEAQGQVRAEPPHPPEGLPPGLEDGLEIGVTLSADARRQAAHSEHEAGTREGEDAARVGPDLGAYRIEGVVLDGGAPVPGARLTVRLGPGASAPAQWQLATGDTGRFGFSTLPAGAFSVVAQYEGRAAHAAATLAPNHEAEHLVLRLQDAAPIRGAVISHDNYLLPGARVMVVAEDDSDPQAQVWTVADDEGTFELPPMTRPVRLAATHREQPLILAEVETRPGDTVELLETWVYALTGRVTLEEDGRPVRVDVRLTPADAEGTPLPLPTSFTTSTNPQGRFTFEGLPDGAYNLAVVSDAYYVAGGAQARHITLAGNADTVQADLRVRRGAQLRVRMLDAQGEAPLRDATVVLKTDGDEARRATTDGGGYVRFEGLAPGGHTVAAVDTGEGVQPLAQPVEVTLAECEGRVLDASGDPVPHAIVRTWRGDGQQPGAVVLSDNVGRFRLPPVSPDTVVSAAAVKDGIFSAVMGPLPADDTLWMSHTHTIALPANGRISGAALDVTGQPLTDARVRIVQLDPGTPAEYGVAPPPVAVGEDGAWGFGALLPGRYRLIVETSGVPRMLTSGGPALELDLEPGAHIARVELVVR